MYKLYPRASVDIVEHGILLVRVKVFRTEDQAVVDESGSPESRDKVIRSDKAYLDTNSTISGMS